MKVSNLLGGDAYAVSHVSFTGRAAEIWRFLFYRFILKKLMNTNLPEQEKLMQWLEKRNLLPLLYPGAIAAAAASAFFADFVCRLWNEQTGGRLLPAGAKKQPFSE